jgi:pyridoxal phosphate enzyme (YggS family)
MLPIPQNCPESVAAVQARIARAASACGRNVDSITLVAVSKTQPAEAVLAAAHAGVEHFGENYLQEALAKIEALRGQELTWHFIGQIQANKTRPIAEHFDWAHGVDRLKIAQRLSDQRPYHAPPLKICLQVHIGGEASKGGVEPQELAALVREVKQLPRVELRGLMCLPPAETDIARQRHWFAETRAWFDRLNDDGAALDTLSMGMSADFEAAIYEGSTMVRVGSAIFGARAPRGEA